MDRLQEQLNFIIEIDKLKHVLRRNYLADGSRRENDTEHSWHLAVMAVLLREYSADKELDLLRALKMILVHDLVEIHAGDTFIYDAQGATDQAEREKAAADELFALLPEDQAKELRSLWDDFEDRSSSEARFVRAIDRLQPIMLNCASRGRAWLEHQVTCEMAIELNPPIIARGAPRLADVARELLLDAREQGFFHETPAIDHCAAVENEGG